MRLRDYSEKEYWRFHDCIKKKIFEVAWLFCKWKKNIFATFFERNSAESQKRFIKKLDRLQLFLENILKVPKEVFQEIRLVATFFGKYLAESHKRFIKKLDRLQLCFEDILAESPERYYKKLDRLQLFLKKIRQSARRDL